MTEHGLHGWLVFIHVLAAMLWVGGVTALCGLALWAGRRSDEVAVARFVSSLRTLGPVLFAPPPLILIGSGIWMVIQDDDVRWGQGWVLAGLALFAAAFAVGAGFSSRAALAAERAVARGDDDEAARRLQQWVGGALIIWLLLVAGTWDMVFKPGG
jgi:uncharacterized membrane protein